MDRRDVVEAVEDGVDATASRGADGEKGICAPLMEESPITKVNCGSQQEDTRMSKEDSDQAEKNGQGPETGLGERNGQNKKDGTRKKARIRIIPPRRPVILHRTRIPWKPQRLLKVEAQLSEEERQTQEIFRKVLGIMNKITPQNFSTMRKQCGNLEINSRERLVGIVIIIFKKAICEPKYAVVYGRLCKELSEMKVLVCATRTAQQELDRLAFPKVLLNCCQLRFQKEPIVEDGVEDLQKTIEEAHDGVEKEIVKMKLETDREEIRRQTLGNIRFIGELFNLRMLTMPIISNCVKKLLIEDDHSLEQLCLLLTTIGKGFDIPKAKETVDGYFDRLKEMRNNQNISTRVRFLIQDVLDLRQNNWVPRHDNLNPKTIYEVHKQAQEAERQTCIMVEEYYKTQEVHRSVDVMDVGDRWDDEKKTT